MAKATSRIRKRFPWLLIGTKMDIYFLIVLLLLATTGLIMMGSASYAVALRDNGSSYYFFKKQLIYLIAGVILMYLVSLVDYRCLKKVFFDPAKKAQSSFGKMMPAISVPMFIYAASIVLLILVLFSPKDANNIQRWIYIGSFQFQPSEFTKFAMILTLSYFIERHYREMGTIKNGYIWFIAFLAVPLALLIKQPHFSCVIIIAIITVTMLFIGKGLSLKTFFAYLGTALVAVPIAVPILLKKIGHIQQRFSLWLDPFADPRGDGYQTIQSLYAVGSGGFFGVGFGNSRQKLLFLPEPQNDFVFAIVCEELGFLGAIIILLMFALLVYRGMRIAIKSKDKFGCMLAFGISLQVGVQALLNIAVVTNSLPNTGISLPFFSAGGTSLVMLLMQMGVVLSVSRTATLEKA